MYSKLFLSTNPISDSSSTSKLELVQIYRGVAAVIVVLHHIAASNKFYLKNDYYNEILSVGWNGVDFFFVLSGFIITYIHFKDLGNRDKFIYFLKKRFIRIYPSFWFFAIIAFAFTLITASKALEVDSIIKTFLLINQKEIPFLGISWSLCYEISFYLLFALYILLGYNFFVIGTCTHLGLILTNFLFPTLLKDIPVISFFSTNYNLEFIIGCVIGILVLYYNELNYYKGYLLLLGFLLFVIAWTLSLETDYFEKSSFYSRIIYGVSSGLIILGASKFQLNFENRLTRLMMNLGDSSYILYLAHPIFLALCYKVFVIVGKNHSAVGNEWSIYTFNLFVFTVCLYFSIYFQRWIEKPMLSFLNNKAFRR